MKFDEFGRPAPGEAALAGYTSWTTVEYRDNRRVRVESVYPIEYRICPDGSVSYYYGQASVSTCDGWYRSES